MPTDTMNQFGPGNSQLERYATRFSAVEINTSFYRPHRRMTYERWADSTPAHFRFSVICPKLITHELRLRGAMSAFDEFIAQVTGLGPRLGCLLVQLPPRLALDSATVRRFAVKCVQGMTVTLRSKPVMHPGSSLRPSSS